MYGLVTLTIIKGAAFCTTLFSGISAEKWLEVKTAIRKTFQIVGGGSLLEDYNDKVPLFTTAVSEMYYLLRLSFKRRCLERKH